MPKVKSVPKDSNETEHVICKDIVEANLNDPNDFIDEDEKYELDKYIFGLLPIKRDDKNKIIEKHLKKEFDEKIKIIG